MDASCITDDGVTETFCVNCDTVLPNMAKKHTTILKKDRNRDLILKRIQDPETWTWGTLADYFGIARETAYQAFHRHATKFVTPQQYQKYLVNSTQMRYK